jgi:antitoxin component YwqK of YwqJK toxin-antitoxin module
MYKNFIYLILISLFIGCENPVSVNDIKNIDNVAYHNNKVFTGIAVDFDENENVRVKVSYKDGFKILTELFYSSGNVQSEWKYGASQISVRRFYKSGKVESEEIFDKKLVRNGLSKSYYKNGLLKREWNFKNGVRDGLQKNYYGDGSLSDETETKNGVQNGYMRIYSRDGKLEKEVYYKEGTQIKI